MRKDPRRHGCGGAGNVWLAMRSVGASSCLKSLQMVVLLARCVWGAMRSVGAAPEAQTRLVSTGLYSFDTFDTQSLPPD